MIHHTGRFHIRVYGLVGSRVRHARGASSNLRGGVCHAPVQRRVEVGRHEDQRSAIERQNSGMVAATRAAGSSEASSVRLARRTFVLARGSLSRRANPRSTRFLRSRWKRGSSW